MRKVNGHFLRHAKVAHIWLCKEANSPYFWLRVDAYPYGLIESFLVANKGGHHVLYGAVDILNSGGSFQHMIKEIKDGFAYKKAGAEIADNGDGRDD